MIASLLSLSLLAAAQDMPPPAAAAPAPAIAATPAKPKLVCQDIEEVGSRLAHGKVCKTREQWAEDRRESRMAVDHAQLQNGSKGN